MQELEYGLEEERNKNRFYEQQLMQLKNGEKKMKGLIVDTEARLRQKEEEVEGLRAEMQKLRGRMWRIWGLLGKDRLCTCRSVRKWNNYRKD
jgi:chromosome segregation ATPase